MADGILLFPVPAVFVGANFGLTAITFMRNLFKDPDLLSDFSIGIILMVFIWNISAALLSLISSNWVLEDSALAKSSIIIMIASYAVIMATCPYYLYSDIKEKTNKTEEVTSAAKVINRDKV